VAGGWRLEDAAQDRRQGDLNEHIDIDRIVEMAQEPGASGVVLDVEDHEDNDRILISIVGDEDEVAQK
jgi:hypothetical protein